MSAVTEQTAPVPPPAMSEKPPKRGLFGHHSNNAPTYPAKHGIPPNSAATAESGGYPAYNNNNNGNMAGGNPGGSGVGRGGFMAGFSASRWFRLHLVDLLTMAVMGAIGLGVYEAKPAPSRSFPVQQTNGEITYPEFGYPLRKNIIPIWLAALLAFIIPFLFFVLFQLRIRSFEALLGTTMGLLESLITGAVFQVFHKWLIGGLRPHFLDVCKPDVSALNPSGNGFLQQYYTRSICTGDPDTIDDSLESWMSGHSTAAFAGFVYLFLYFNAQLKCMADYRPAYWKMVVTIAPLLGASLIAASLTVDEFHNWHDCVGGAITGTLCACVAYRKTFAAIWDFRFNHFLLPRTSSLVLKYQAGEAGVNDQLKFQYSRMEAMMQLPVASEGGWRRDLGIAGAPSDAVGV